MSEKTVIWIPGEPSRVTHQSGTRIGKNGRIYKKKALIEWEEVLSQATKPYAPAQPIEGPISLEIDFAFHSNRSADIKSFYKTTRPDTDNLVKTLKDVMTRMGFWKDDAQIVVERCSKFWSKDPGIGIVVEPLEER